MNKKPRLLIFSDSAIVSGSEKGIATLYSDISFGNQFYLYFVYNSASTYDPFFYGKPIASLKIKPLRLAPNRLQGVESESKPNRKSRCTNFFFTSLLIKGIQLVLDYLKLLALVFSVRPHLVLVNNGGLPGSRSAILLSWITSRLGIPTYVYVNNLYKGSQSKFYEEFITRVIKDPRVLLIGNCEAVRSSLQNRFSELMNSPIAIVSCAGGNIDGFTSTRRWREQQPKRYDFIAVGLLEHRKGHEDLLQAVYCLATQKGIRCTGRIVGTGPLYQRLESRISELGLRDQISVVPWNSFWFSDALEASFLVHPSREFEGIPLVILEAMGLGMPILATDVGGIPEAITDKVTGLLVKPRNVDTLMDGIERLMTESHTRHTCGYGAYQRYSADFRVAKYVSAWIQVLTQPYPKRRPK